MPTQPRRRDDSSGTPRQRSGSTALPLGHAVLFSATFVVLVVCELLIAGATSPLAVLGGAGTAIGVGIAAGAIMGGLFTLLQRFPAGWMAAVWIVAGMAMGQSVAYRLGVWSRLGTADHRLAVLALVGCTIGGLALAGLGLAVQPTRGRPGGWTASLSPRVRTALALGLIAAFLGTIYVDREFEPDGYLPAHRLLRWVGLCCLYAALLVRVMSVQHLSVGLRRLATVGYPFVLAVSVFSLRDSNAMALDELAEHPYSALALDFARQPADFDRDGYSPLFGGGDCKPFDAGVHPGAAEIPDNGVDDNCRFGDARRDAEYHVDTQVPVPSGASPLSVVLVTIDTVSAPRLSLYGGPNETWPEITDWASDALVFDRAFTSGGWTSLAMSSMFRGVYPRRLTWTRLFETSKYRLLRVPFEGQLQANERVRLMFALPLDDRRPPLAYWLRRRGMHTVAVVNDGRSEFLDPQFMGTGFDEYIDLDRTDDDGPHDDADVTRAALEALESLPDRPFFMWVHYFGPHTSGAERPEVPDFGSDRVARYDEQLRFTDMQVAQFLGAVDQLAQTRAIAVMVLADHGEVVHRHSRGHGRTLADAAIHIPLMLRVPGQPGGRVSAVASTVDVSPTILALTNTPGPPTDGLNLLEMASAPEAWSDRVVLSETWRFDGDGESTHDLIAALNGRHKLTFNRLRNTERLDSQDTAKHDSPELRDATLSDEPILRAALRDYIEESGHVRLMD